MTRKAAPPVDLEPPRVVEIEPHELFLPESEDDDLIGPPTMVYVSITRTRPWVENAGKVFRHDELPDADAVRERFGGGTFQLAARDGKKRVLARREITTHGKPLPMDGSKPEVEDVDPRKLAAVSAERSDAATFAEAMKSIAGTFTTSLDRVMAMQADLRSADRENTKAMIDTMGKFYQSLADVYSKAPAAQSPTTSADEFRAGMEYMQTQVDTMMDKMQRRKEDEPENGSMADDIKGISSLVETIANLTNKNKPAAGAA